ncbi:hypothetical protein ACU4GD_37740 [Cupriavidus basilensis]
MIGFRPPARLRFSRINIALGIGGYAGAILLVTVELARRFALVARRGRASRALRRLACAGGPARPCAGERGGDGTGQSRDRLDLWRIHPART